MAGISTVGQSLAQISRITNLQIQYSDLTRQLATGKKTDKFSGLGQNVMVTQRSRSDVRALEVYQNNIVNAERRIQLTLTTIQEFKAQAGNLANALINFVEEGNHQQGTPVFEDDTEQVAVGMNSAVPSSELQTLQDLSENIYDFLVDLINDQDGDRYLFGGADSFTAPLNDSGTLDAAVSSLIKRWKLDPVDPNNLGTTNLISSLRNRESATISSALTDSIVGYSPALSAGNVGDLYVRVDDRQEINYTALATEQGFRDILVAAAYFKNGDLYPLSDVYAEPYTPGDPTTADGAPGANLEEQRQNFFAVFNSLTEMVNTALDQLDDVEAKLQNALVRMKQTQQSHKLESSVLQSIIADRENADINEVAVSLNSLEITLQASFSVTAQTQQLSLVNYLNF